MDKQAKLEKLNQMSANTLMETLEIQFSDFGEDFMEATMPVSPKVHQPYGILHGGASIALAETVGSVLSATSIDTQKFKSVGMQMTSNHLRPKREGVVTARAEFVRKGSRVHLIKIEIRDEEGQMVCYCHLTTSIVPNDYV
ncbi:PaaI family thioesterase [Moheibacter sp.]|uniref:PaaI family thioesterase n=1 Tax=Moheibacter sp. TaxID=1965316 RepID=UPI003C791F85